jgi:hypothetical protein
LVDAETWGNIPMVNTGISGRMPVHSYRNNGFRYYSDIRPIVLGDLNDYEDDYFPFISQDGAYIHVSVTITDFEIIGVYDGRPSGNFGIIETIRFID